MKPLTKIKWVLMLSWSAVFLWALIDFIDRNFDSSFTYTGDVEGRVFLISIMLALSFPSGFLVTALFWTLDKFDLNCCPFGSNTTIVETIIVWAAFYLAGFLQWFILMPIIFEALIKRIKKPA